MIPHGTIERLDHLMRLIDCKKDYQDERIRQGITYRPDYEIDDQLLFPPPKLTKGEVTENSLYQWIEQLCLGYEEEQRLSSLLQAEYTYGSWGDDAWLTPQPDLSELQVFPDDEEDFGAKLRVVADYSPGPAAIPDEEEEEEPANDEKTTYSAPRFSWPEK